MHDLLVQSTGFKGIDCIVHALYMHCTYTFTCMLSTFFITDEAKMQLMFSPTPGSCLDWEVSTMSIIMVHAWS